jgi:hypothetical protein
MSNKRPAAVRAAAAAVLLLLLPLVVPLVVLRCSCCITEASLHTLCP